METVSATDFRKDFGTCISLAERAPVMITRKDKPPMVVMPLALLDKLAAGKVG